MVRCRVCGQLFKMASSHIVRKHNLSPVQYRKKFPGAPLESRSVKEARSKAQAWQRTPNARKAARKRALAQCTLAERKHRSRRAKRQDLTSMRAGHARYMTATKEIRSERTRKQMTKPGAKKRMRESTIKQMSDPKVRKRLSQTMRATMSRPEMKKLASKQAKKLAREREHHPEWEEKHQEALKEMWQRPGFREKHAKRMSKQSKELWKDPAYANKMRKHLFKWSKPERIIRRWLKRLGVYHTVGGSFKPHKTILCASVDFSSVELKVAIFEDGDHWHDPVKFPSVAKRDREVTRRLRRAGWVVLRLKEADVKSNPAWCRRRIREVISKRSS